MDAALIETLNHNSKMLDLGRINVGPWQNKCWTQGRQNVGSLSDKKLAKTFRRQGCTKLVSAVSRYEPNSKF